MELKAWQTEKFKSFFFRFTVRYAFEMEIRFFAYSFITAARQQTIRFTSSFNFLDLKFDYIEYRLALAF